jgi:hypothetical protein
MKFIVDETLPFSVVAVLTKYCSVESVSKNTIIKHLLLLRDQAVEDITKTLPQEFGIAFDG